MLRTLLHKPFITTYPEFSKLQLEHKQVFDKFGHKFGYYCDFNFIDIYSWDVNDDIGVSLLNDNLVVKKPDYLTGETYYSILGKNKIDESLATLLKEAKELNLVPGVVVDHIKDKSKFIITNDRDGQDYIYRVSDLLELKGKKYKNVRNHLNNFKREFEDFDKLNVSTTSIVNLDRFKSFHDVFYTWTKEKELSDKKTQYEKIAINRLLENSHEFDLLIIEIRLGDELVAFSINNIVAPSFVITHFEKAIKIHEHFNTYVIHEVARVQNEFGCKKVNWEQDLGLPGLRRNKSSYQPIEMLNKYQITLND